MSQAAQAPSREEALSLIELLNTGRPVEAIALGEKFAAKYPRSIALCNMLGAACIDVKRLDQAVIWFGKAARLDPANVEPLYSLCVTLQEMGRKSEAVACCDRILRIQPDHADIMGQKLLLHAHMCDWDTLKAAAQAGAVRNLGIIGKAAPTFALLPLEDNAERHRLRSEKYAAENFGPPTLPAIAPPAAKPEKLRIGYFSADFKEHPVASLMARVLELHDRSRFELVGYAFGPPVEDSMRDRIRRSVDLFRDVQALTPQQMAEQARRDRIDIAVDLTGYTTYSRTGAFACRAAPVQISYLGYPGTMGTSFIDYIIADRNLIPTELQRFYSEKPIYLPHSYQAQDDQLKIAEPTPTRASLGLPEDAFVFCAINNSYKILPGMFDQWMGLLRQVENSVLWLFRPNSWAEANLVKEAQKRGVDPARIIFADRKPFADYLAQFRQADLFLDTYPYNAGATASNALWAGLPVVTMMGASYPSRMAGSLLRAVGLPELATSSIDAYTALAFDLATHPAKLAEIRRRLAHNRDSMKLFDSDLFTRHLEDGYMLAYQRWFEREAPGVIDVPDRSKPASPPTA